MNGFQRYGIYYLPEPGALAAFGASWLGWDVFTGTEAAHPDLPGFDIASLTATPRKYGFHGTIKPPFFLAEGTTAEALHAALSTLTASAAPVQLDSLEPAVLGSFLALRPVGDQSALAALATRVVKELDTFRAPPSEAELTRRRSRKLSPTQEANLAAWGYPYVMEEFRFHMTLSGSIAEPEKRDATLAALTPLVAPTLTAPFDIASLCLVGSDDAGRFRLIQRYPLAGA